MYLQCHCIFPCQLNGSFHSPPYFVLWRCKNFVLLAIVKMKNLGFSSCINNEYTSVRTLIRSSREGRATAPSGHIVPTCYLLGSLLMSCSAIAEREAKYDRFILHLPPRPLLQVQPLFVPLLLDCSFLGLPCPSLPAMQASTPQGRREGSLWEGVWLLPEQRGWVCSAPSPRC